MALVPRRSIFDSDGLFGDFFMPQVPDREVAQSFFTPRVDIKDNDDHYEITAELPGVAKEDIHITLSDGVLTLEAESNQEDKEEKEGKIIRQERRYGKFMRSFNLGPEVHEEDISADFRDGLLALRAPKLKEVPPSQRRIQIN
jgi:HSP20 family protein